MIKSEQINELAAALAKAQGELKSAKKDSSGYGYNYSDLASVIDTLQPVFPKHGLSYVQLPGNSEKEGEATVTTILMHSSGQYIGETASIRIPEMNKVNDTQRHGAALSYLRRYMLQAVAGMASEDNDAASEPAPAQAKSSFKVATKSFPEKTEQQVTSELETKNKKVADEKKGVAFKTFQVNL